MNLDDVGIILTIIFGVFGLIALAIAWKAWFRPKIQLITESATVLANLSNSSSDISLKYKNEDVSSNLILISAYLINTGNTDIDKRDVEKPISLTLPKGSNWYSFHLIYNINEMKIETSYSQNKLVINVGLWKKSEGIKFDALISIDDESVLNEKNKILNKLIISSRIKGLDTIEIAQIPEGKLYKSKFKKYMNLFFPSLLMMVYVVLGVIILSGILSKNKYEFGVYDNKSEKVILTIASGMPLVGSKSGKLEADGDGFYNLKIKPIKIKDERGEQVFGILITFFGILGLIIFNLKSVRSFLLQKKIDKVKR